VTLLAAEEVWRVAVTLVTVAAIRRDLAERGLLGVGYRLGLDVVDTEVRADGVPVSIQFRERDNEPAAR
jgi:hypothetical protein